jgi:hypothetical protein
MTMASGWINCNHFPPRILLGLYLLAKSSEAKVGRVLLSNESLRKLFNVRKINRDRLTDLAKDLISFFPQYEIVYEGSYLTLALCRDQTKHTQELKIESLPSTDAILNAFDIKLHPIESEECKMREMFKISSQYFQ